MFHYMQTFKLQFLRLVGNMEANRLMTGRLMWPRAVLPGSHSRQWLFRSRWHADVEMRSVDGLYKSLRSMSVV